MTEHHTRTRELTIWSAGIVYGYVLVLLIWNLPADLLAAPVIDTEQAIALWTANSAFGSYDVKTAIEPVSGEVPFNPPWIFRSTPGGFQITSVSAPATDSASDVPLPASFLLFGSGLFSVAVVRRLCKAESVGDRYHTTSEDDLRVAS